MVTATEEEALKRGDKEGGIELAALWPGSLAG